ncbi:MAG TPA: M3 family oligoendopeptidase [Fimbriimonas sp.]|nr:M3 family oligoendopeptidase [Fimbriimonas sp.]
MAAIADAGQLPGWDMSTVFPSLSSPEFSKAFAEADGDLESLGLHFDRAGIEKSRQRIQISSEEFESALEGLNSLAAQLRLLRSYVTAFVTTDSRNAEALAKASELDRISAGYGKLMKRFTAWVGSSDVHALLSQSQVARDHRFFVTRSSEAAEHQMAPDLESLSSDLEVTGSIAWKKLHSNVTSQLSVEIEPGKALPMSAVRGLATDPDREIRALAYRAELAAWKQTEVPLAAAMNSVKGEALSLSDRRGWGSPLDAALFSANIDRATLEAMLEAARLSFGDFRRYLSLKARALGLEKLAFYDLFAPLPQASKVWIYEEAERFVADQFATYSPKMGEFARMSFREQWLDTGPRGGKVDGAYCMQVRPGESRVLMNFKPSFSSVSTLAHELGHAYHNLCLKDRTELQMATPMTLAETASIFCETIIRRAVLDGNDEEAKLPVLEASLQGTCQVVVDIYSRFLFEQRTFEKRAARELSAGEMCEIMRQAQLDTYGDGLEPELLHPYMWAAKPHYYGRSFYNFPYMFGLLFGLGLYAIYRQEGDSFKARYDDLLSSTGMADAATLAQRFGIDIRSTKFWEGSLDQIRADIDQFETLVSV